ncbi:hypothetical protein H2200_003143 [Cladophialophora chaetospira]|uniref:AAA+ ATPase domain-containing protein n=1 Tax=Cladophialophora chaetospira TaxID=386627 RepID=A0AA38XGW1_9EURO|nr:hypothetical protein H2200_003143 [Cladophialophora chaetospira]
MLANSNHAERRPAPTVTVGLDGTCDDGVVLLKKAEPAKLDVCIPALSNQSTSLPPAETRTQGLWHIAEGDDLEKENTRVKRRKVSDEPIQAPLETEGGSITTALTWHDQLQDAARTLVPKGEEIDANEPHYQVLQATDLDVSRPAETAIRPTPAPQPPFDTSSITVEIEPPHPSANFSVQTDGAMDDPPLKRIKASSTPKKKLLRSDHGKLSFSPKKSPRRSPRVGTVQQNSESKGSAKTAKSAKKVEMKNGKFVSSLQVSLPYSAPDSAARIDEILSGKPQKGSTETPAAQAPAMPNKSAPPKTTHPFFMGKTAVKAQQQQNESKSEQSSVVIVSDDEAKIRGSPKPPKAWKDIVFGSGKPAKQIVSSLPPIWPPIAFQHIHPSRDRLVSTLTHVSTSKRPAKLKQRDLRLRADEDVLQVFSAGLTPHADSSTLQLPGRKVMSGKELAGAVSSELEAGSVQPSRLRSLASLKARIESASSCFDNGMAAGPQMWSQEYAPTCWQDVLEDQSKTLHDWLDNLRVNQVQSGKLHKAKLPTPKKQRRKRKSDELDDFIADSDDDARSTASGKNAILLVGPPGSGKTASVFAVAQNLGFEVFEIHPGMRRSAKDIQDKVGDMMQNHLVQQSSTLSRESSASIDDRAALTEPLPANQKTMAGFMNAPKRGKQPKPAAKQDNAESKTKSQKQSVILFEEADILFDEDKGFWTHVQWLIRSTKRPVILTCNDTDSVPIDDLDLFAVLHYGHPDTEDAVQHLAHIAAAEGHLLGKEALRTLYLTKGRDLRAAITELSLWCQMTVGSQQGGLDWMLPYEDKRKPNPDGSVTRIVSQDTYTSGLDLLPHRFEDTEDLVRFTQDSLGISLLDWVQDDVCSNAADTKSIQALSDMLILSDTKSALDLFDDATSPILAGAMKRFCGSATTTTPATRDEVVRLYLNTMASTPPTRSKISGIFDSLLDEPRIGLPAAPGRKAPSLDNPSAISIITEVAPYIRSIVSHDKRLEQLRTELHSGSQTGSSKRQRRTRASRAAMEGGNKGTTRRDKWFPEELDWDAVLGTGNGWPMVGDEETNASEIASGVVSNEETPTATPSSSLATDVGVEV